jgi:crossover junction endodeoxyribonuclease RusA
MITLSLPYPPSANRLWRSVPGKGVLKSAAYRGWLNDAAKWVTIQAGGKFIVGHFAIAIEAERPDRRRRDLDNLAKPTMDALTHSGVITDDSFARRIILCWSDKEPSKPGALHITLREAA